ncbi:MAG: (Fe-S)-binding protein, partial [Terriglobia bacterium]
AMYNAEFLSHYYAGRIRPRHAYAIGYIHRWAGLASHFPQLANFFGHAPLLGSLAKLAAGISRHRELPPFADETFKSWHARTRRRRVPPASVNGGDGEKPQVILWADTFNNYFHPPVAQAAVEVLEAAGCAVRVPRRNLCCGRPLYDYGMLDSAKRLLDETIETLRAPIRAGIPIVVLEPSCAAVFRDELVNLYPHDEDAKRLSRQTFLLSEFLDKELPEYHPPSLHRKAIVHGHCHHRAIMTMESEKRVLDKMGLDYNLLDSGCCGMAGGFGFEKEHYELSVNVGEHVLLPAVRKASDETLIIANGFSCREQILQTTERRALHLAEVLQMALRGDGSSADEAQAASAGEDRNRATVAVLAASAALVAGGILLEEWVRRRA